MISCRPLKKRNILVIGDSNGAHERGWVFQFQQLRKGGPLVNTAIGGNTLGFNGMNDPNRNTLNKYVDYLRLGFAEMGGIDEILIGLGTNDCKYEYRDKATERELHYRELLNAIERFFTERGQQIPRIVLISPPPVAENDKLSDEFQDAAVCVRELTMFIEQLAVDRGLCFVNLLDNPGTEVLTHSPDGIHFEAMGHQKIARAIIETCY